MTVNLPLAEVKNRLSEVVERLEREHDRVVITKHGRPSAVLLSVDDLESLEETLAILSDSNLMADLRASADDIEEGHVEPLDRAQALERVTRR